jgi:DNA repair protein RecO (recombination protein O)
VNIRSDSVCYHPRFVKQRRDEAYVLGTSELGEADLIVTLLSEQHGRVRGVAASARKSRRRFGGAVDPMTRVSARWVERPGRELHRIESLELVRSFAAMQAEPRVLAACAVLSEIVQATAHEEQGDPATFRLVGALLEALEQGLAPWAAVRYAEYWALKLHGVLPDLDACAACGEPFSPGEARAVARGVGLLCKRCPKPAGSVVLREVEAAALAAIERTPPARLELPAEAVRPRGGLESLLRGALEAFVERKLRTYRHLRAVDAGAGS